MLPQDPFGVPVQFERGEGMPEGGPEAVEGLRQCPPWGVQRLAGP
jgi:hypothetical protein